MHKNQLIKLEDYEPFIAARVIERIRKKAEPLEGRHVTHVSSTFYGGGVAVLLDSLTLLLHSVGMNAGWRIIQGAPDFFGITKKMHNALQGQAINLSHRKQQIYEGVVGKNALRNHLEAHDYVIVHDPQPLPLVDHYRRRGPWIWRCHVDLTSPDPGLWSYLVPFIEHYDAVILSLEEYRQKLSVPQLFFLPAIDPFAITNIELSEDEVSQRLSHYGIPTDLPIVAQISRFDRWKDPLGVIHAAEIARKEVDFTLVLLGNLATDDPEGSHVYDSLLARRSERVVILSRDDTALVNALQRRAAVILQKSLKEGFGLTVTEAMWKGTPVIGGNVGGIRHQIQDGVNGFLVSSVEEAAARIVQLLRDQKLRLALGQKARETVRKHFLMTRLLEQYLDLFNSFETTYRLRTDRLAELTD
jgi:trehalose synthase